MPLFGGFLPALYFKRCYFDRHGRLFLPVNRHAPAPSTAVESGSALCFEWLGHGVIVLITDIRELV